MYRAVAAVLICALSSSCTLLGAGLGAGAAEVQNGITDRDRASVGAYALTGALVGLIVDVLFLWELKNGGLIPGPDN